MSHCCRDCDCVSPTCFSSVAIWCECAATRALHSNCVFVNHTCTQISIECAGTEQPWYYEGNGMLYKCRSKFWLWSCWFHMGSRLTNFSSQQSKVLFFQILYFMGEFSISILPSLSLLFLVYAWILVTNLGPIDSESPHTSMFNMYYNVIKRMLRDGCAGIPNLSPNLFTIQTMFRKENTIF